MLILQRVAHSRLATRVQSGGSSTWCDIVMTGERESLSKSREPEARTTVPKPAEGGGVSLRDRVGREEEGERTSAEGPQTGQVPPGTCLQYIYTGLVQTQRRTRQCEDETWVGGLAS